MILDNGVIRTMDPSLPTAGALAIAGPLRRRRGWHARVDAPDSRPRRSRGPLRFACLHGLARALPDLGSGAPRCSPRGRELGRLGPRARRGLSRSREHVDPRHRLARLGLAGSADRSRPRRGNGNDTCRSLVEGLPLALDQHRRARQGGGRPRGAGRGRRTRGRRPSHRHPPRGIGVALPRALRHRHRGRVGRGDARRDPARERTRGRGDSRQGRLARRRLDLRPDPRARGAVYPRLAVASRRPATGAGSPAVAIPNRRRLPPPRLREDVHGRDARVADRAHARRLRRGDHEPRGVRADRP